MDNKTKLLSIRDSNATDLASKYVADGGLIAFPTDTVYGIGVTAFNPQAIEMIYEVKGRSHLKAIPILIGGQEELDRITPARSAIVQKIIENFWPGALTLVLPLLPDMPSNLSPTPTVGLRVPDHDLVRQLLRVTGPLAATSANLTGQPSALTAAEVLEQLDGRIDLALDGGPAPGGQASTVLDCTGKEPKVLREGPVKWTEILQAIS